MGPCTHLVALGQEVGTEQANALHFARRCNVQPCKSIPRPECGKVMCPGHGLSKVSRFWALHSGNRSTSRPSWTNGLHSTGFFLERNPVLNELQSGWLLLTLCAATQANFTLRNVMPTCGSVLARQIPTSSVQTASLPLRLGGLEVSSAEGTLLHIGQAGVILWR